MTIELCMPITCKRTIETEAGEEDATLMGASRRRTASARQVLTQLVA